MPRARMSGGDQTEFRLPILHLSISVADLDRAVAFYADALGCRRGRRRDRFADVWFFGAQLTLYLDPSTVPSSATRALADGHRQHFGATVEIDQLRRVTDAVLDGGGHVVSGPTTSGSGGREQTKVMFADPDGNLIELKSYPDPATALAD